MKKKPIDKLNEMRAKGQPELNEEMLIFQNLLANSVRTDEPSKETLEAIGSAAIAAAKSHKEFNAWKAVEAFDREGQNAKQKVKEQDKRILVYAACKELLAKGDDASLAILKDIAEDFQFPFDELARQGLEIEPNPTVLTTKELILVNPEYRGRDPVAHFRRKAIEQLGLKLDDARETGDWESLSDS
ncbi:hypothetical protein G0Q06_02175 [Puniceicoccales bacterium CK1056]|uniref:Uncharacterized protein n=1 Tax=Oceanipulchritudo coccoides TaxID=2706888 RepID=A0A6B2LY39_9BACT|nr:hypothetical protein [Oceanipulchritudo coccoides]NDV61253.1 hypothetical protein [Oceanipulchritudo coccoides]